MEVPIELAQNYLRRRVSDLEHLERALMISDYRVCESIAHRLKGSAKSFGFEDLAHLATALEKNAKEENMDSLASNVDDFKTWVNKYIN